MGEAAARSLHASTMAVELLQSEPRRGYELAAAYITRGVGPWPTCTGSTRLPRTYS